MGHALWALAHLFAFSHAQCDAYLSVHKIEIAGAFERDKAGFLTESYVITIPGILGWEAFAIWSSVDLWRTKNPNLRTLIWRFLLPCAAFAGLVVVWIALHGVVDYVETCSSVLLRH